MKTRHALARQIEASFVAQRYDEAEALLDEGLAEQPADPDLNAWQVIFLALHQRELDALDHLPLAKGSEWFEEGAQMIANHFECRRQMAARLGVHDSVGEQALEVVEESFPAGPEAGIGIGLSAVLIVKNEAENLPRCLKSLQGIADEIIVVDTGSTDDTVKIAEQFGAKLGSFEWCNHFAKARNASLELATQPWCLWIDADEELDPASLNMLREGIMRPQFGGYFIEIQNFLGEGQPANTFVHAPLRLWRNHPDIRFEGRIHEQIVGGILEKGWYTATMNGVRLNHYGYLSEMMISRDKSARTIGLLKQAIEEEPEFAFHWFNLAMAYAVGQQWNECIEAAERALEFMHERAAYHGNTYHLLASAHVNLNRCEEALAICERAAADGYDSLLLSYERGQALLKLGRTEEALAEAERCAALDWPSGMTGDFGIFTHKRWSLVGRLRAERGDYARALEALDLALAGNPEFKDAIGLKGAVLLQLGRLEEARPWLEQCLADPIDRLEALRLLGTLAARQERYPEACFHYTELWEAGVHTRDLAHVWMEAATASGSLPAVNKVYGLAVAEWPLDLGLRVDWAVVLSGLGETMAALDQITYVIERDPASPRAFFVLGDLFLAAGEFGQAASSYELALRYQPDYAQGWFVYGNALAHQGETLRAAAAYQQALALEPGHQAAAHNLGLMLDGAA